MPSADFLARSVGAFFRPGSLVAAFRAWRGPERRWVAEVRDDSGSSSAFFAALAALAFAVAASTRGLTR
jgi:hypothetical protein